MSVVPFPQNINLGAEILLNNSPALSSNGTDNIFKIIDHGCWCAKMNPVNDKTILGGPSPIDGLDEICKSWFNTRFCNDHISGGQCKDNKMFDSYSIKRADSDFACIQDGDVCNQSSCVIDKHFSDLIAEYVDSNPVVWETVTQAGRCQPLPSFSTGNATSSGSLNQAEALSSGKSHLPFKQCVGEAPNLSIEVFDAQPSEEESPSGYFLNILGIGYQDLVTKSYFGSQNGRYWTFQKS